MELLVRIVLVGATAMVFALSVPQQNPAEFDILITAYPSLFWNTIRYLNVAVVVVAVLRNDGDGLLHCSVWSVSCSWLSLAADLVTCSWLPP